MDAIKFKDQYLSTSKTGISHCINFEFAASSYRIFFYKSILEFVGALWALGDDKASAATAERGAVHLT